MKSPVKKRSHGCVQWILTDPFLQCGSWAPDLLACESLQSDRHFKRHSSVSDGHLLRMRFLTPTSTAP
jgi:hypothetical protein